MECTENRRELTYTQFIEELKALGFNITVEISSPGESDFSLYVNGIRIPGSNYPIFGRCCGGTYAPCSFSDKSLFSDTDLKKAIRYCSQILMQEIDRVKKIPNFFTCRDYFNNKGYKTKVEELSIKRTFMLIKENYNDIVRKTSDNIIK